MNLEELNGKFLTLVLAGEGEDWSVLRGIVRQEGEVVLLDHSAGKAFHIQPEWLDRIKPTPADLREILMNAEFFLPLSMGAMPEDADPSDYINSSLKLSE